MGLGQMISIRCGADRGRCLFVIRSVFHRRQRGFQCPGIAYPMQPAKLLDGTRMNGEYFVRAEEKQSNLLFCPLSQSGIGTLTLRKDCLSHCRKLLSTVSFVERLHNEGTVDEGEFYFIPNRYS